MKVSYPGMMNNYLLAHIVQQKHKVVANHAKNSNVGQGKVCGS